MLSGRGRTDLEDMGDVGVHTQWSLQSLPYSRVGLKEERKSQLSVIN